MKTLNLVTGLKTFMDLGSDHYENYSFGITYRGLRDSAVTTDADHQATIFTLSSNSESFNAFDKTQFIFGPSTS
jgi:hypothetical protein